MPGIGSSARRISDSSAVQSMVAIRNRRPAINGARCVSVGATTQAAGPQQSSTWAGNVFWSMVQLETL
jgi:hypothetical protein